MPGPRIQRRLMSRCSSAVSRTLSCLAGAVIVLMSRGLSGGRACRGPSPIPSPGPCRTSSWSSRRCAWLVAVGRNDCSRGSRSAGCCGRDELFPRQPGRAQSSSRRPASCTRRSRWARARSVCRSKSRRRSASRTGARSSRTRPRISIRRDPLWFAVVDAIAALSAFQPLVFRSLARSGATSS